MMPLRGLNNVRAGGRAHVNLKKTVMLSEVSANKSESTDWSKIKKGGEDHIRLQNWETIGHATRYPRRVEAPLAAVGGSLAISEAHSLDAELLHCPLIELIVPEV